MYVKDRLDISYNSWVVPTFMVRAMGRGLQGGSVAVMKAHGYPKTTVTGRT